MKPFKEEQLEGSVYVRTFSSETPESELKWHWDEEDRIIEAIEPTDWKFQFDNQLPISFDKPIRVDAGDFHRVIKGAGNLVVKVTKLPTAERINRL
jgi:hypothetical protein